MAIEDGWVLAEHVGAQRAQRSGETSGVDWDSALAAYEAVRPEHCCRVILTARRWGEFWHHDGAKRLQRNTLLRARDIYDYAFTDWIYGPTALTPDQEPETHPDNPAGRGHGLSGLLGLVGTLGPEPDRRAAGAGVGWKLRSPPRQGCGDDRNSLPTRAPKTPPDDGSSG